MPRTGVSLPPCPGINRSHPAIHLNHIHQYISITSINTSQSHPSIHLNHIHQYISITSTNTSQSHPSIHLNHIHQYISITSINTSQSHPSITYISHTRNASRLDSSRHEAHQPSPDNDTSHSIARDAKPPNRSDAAIITIGASVAVSCCCDFNASSLLQRHSIATRPTSISNSNSLLELVKDSLSIAEQRLISQHQVRRIASKLLAYWRSLSSNRLDLQVRCTATSSKNRPADSIRSRSSVQQHCHTNANSTAIIHCVCSADQQSHDRDLVCASRLRGRERLGRQALRQELELAGSLSRAAGLRQRGAPTGTDHHPSSFLRCHDAGPQLVARRSHG